jgi:hypothetical protein
MEAELEYALKNFAEALQEQRGQFVIDEMCKRLAHAICARPASPPPKTVISMNSKVTA